MRLLCFLACLLVVLFSVIDVELMERFAERTVAAVCRMNETSVLVDDATERIG